MNTTATTCISDAGAAPVGHQLQRLPISCQPTSTAPVVHYVPAKSWYQLILLGGQRHVHVNNLPKVVTW